MLVITLVGALMFCATGGIIFEMWKYGSNVTGYLIGTGFIAFVNGLVYFGDFILTVLKYRNQ